MAWSTSTDNKFYYCKYLADGQKLYNLNINDDTPETYTYFYDFSCCFGELIENRNVERYGNTAIFLCTSIKVFVYEIKIIQRFKRL